jgi:hypothetical protein
MKKNSKVTITVEIDRKELSEFIKQKMIQDGYPEKDLADIEEFLDEGDIANYCFGSLVDAEAITID